MRKGFVFYIALFLVLFCSTVSKGADDLSRKTNPCDWCDEIGMYDIMQNMKSITKVITEKLMYTEWEELTKLNTKLKSLYGQLDLKGPNIPDEYFEFDEDFMRYLGRFITACEKKDEKDAVFQLKRVKTACWHCHIRFVRRRQTDDGVALERLYKDQFKEWGDGQSYNTPKKNK